MYDKCNENCKYFEKIIEDNEPMIEYQSKSLGVSKEKFIEEYGTYKSCELLCESIGEIEFCPLKLPETIPVKSDLLVDWYCNVNIYENHEDGFDLMQDSIKSILKNSIKK